MNGGSFSSVESGNSLSGFAKLSGSIAFFDPIPPYVKQIQGLVALERLRAAGLTVMVDAMWGNGAGWFGRFLSGGKTQVLQIHGERNPVFPEMSRPEPIPPNVDVGLAAAKSRAYVIAQQPWFAGLLAEDTDEQEPQIPEAIAQ